MNRKLRNGLIGAAGLLALVLALPFLVPMGVYKERIEQSVGRMTGRTFAIQGPVRFTLFPWLGLSAERISLSNPKGRPGALATAAELRVGVRLLPLLIGRVEVSEIAVDRPDIALEVDAAGRANWTLARERKPAGPGAARGGAVEAHFSGLKITHGRVRYANARTHSARSIDDIDATVDLTELDRPVVVVGTFAFNGRRIAFNARTPVPRALLEERKGEVELGLKSDLIEAGFAGAIAPDGAADGFMSLRAPNLREAVSWLGLKPPEGGGLKSFLLIARFRGDSHTAELRDFTITLDGAHFGGRLALDMRGEVPMVKGTLAADRLDLNPYIASAPKGGPAAPPKPETESDEWSAAPIALDALKKFDADLVLETQSLTVKALKLGKTKIALTLKDGGFHALLGPMALYGGSGTGDLAIDTRGAVPVFRNTAEFDGVALAPFFADTIGVTEIEGTGTIKLDVAAAGTSARAIMRELSGTGSIAFRDGRLTGVDLGAVARTIQFVLGGATGQGAFTDYSQMSGSFALSHGVLASNDFHLLGPLIQTTGSGIVDIGGRSIDFKIVPKASASIAKLKLSVGVPFRIKGPWKHVRYAPDLAGAVGSLLDNLDVFDRPDTKKKHKSTGDAIKNMLGIH